MKKKKDADGGSDRLFKNMLGLVKDNSELIDRTAGKAEWELTEEEREGYSKMEKLAEKIVAPFLKGMIKQIEDNVAKGAGALAPLTAERFHSLPDEALYEALQEQTVDLVLDGDPETMSGVPEPVRTFARVNDFVIEFGDGGVAQYLCSQPQPDVPPSLPECLTRIGADAHRALLERFFSENAIDLSDLSAFSFKRMKKLTKQYDFEAFDDAFSALPDLKDLLVAYARAHADAFCGPVPGSGEAQ